MQKYTGFVHAQKYSHTAREEEGGADGGDRPLEKASTLRSAVSNLECHTRLLNRSEIHQ